MSEAEQVCLWCCCSQMKVVIVGPGSMKWKYQSDGHDPGPGRYS